MTKTERATMQDRLTEMEREIEVMKTKLNDADTPWYEQEWSIEKDEGGSCVYNLMMADEHRIAQYMNKEEVAFFMGTQKLVKACKNHLTKTGFHDHIEEALRVMGVEV